MSDAAQLTAGEVGYFKGGSGFPIRYQGSRSGQLPFFKVSDMNNPGNELFMRRSNNYISEAQRKRLGAARIPAGAIVFAKVGAAVYLERKRILSEDSCIDNNMAAFIIDKRKLDVRLAHYLLTSFRLSSLVATTALPSLNGTQLRSIPLRVPGSLVEQRRIAEALADADEVVTTLESLVAKKQAIKLGMMQQLLTGRTRLPGFSAGWAAVTLRDAGSTYGGLTGKSKDDFGTGTATYVTFMEVMAGARLRGNLLERVRVRQGERQNRVFRGDVLFNGSSETPEEVALAAVVGFDPAPSTYLNSFCFGYRLKDRGVVDPAYLAYFFRSRAGRDLVSALAQGATRYNIAKTKLMQARPVLPPIGEQQAIVRVLREGEAEIEALQRRLAKARDIKTGMMQQLLTGRVRMPAEAAS